MRTVSLMVAVAVAGVAMAQNSGVEKKSPAFTASSMGHPVWSVQNPSAESKPAPQAGGGLLGIPVAPNEEPGVRKARELLEQMVQALGGQAYLEIKDMEQDGRSFGFSHGEAAGTGTLFWRFWKWPDKERVEFTKQRDVVLINNGDKGYEITFRGTAAEEKEQLEDYLRRRHYSLEHVLRLWLKQPGVALFYEGQALAERKQAAVVTILNAQNEAVTIYVDQNTHLPIKKSFTWRDPKYRDKIEESEGYANYRQVQGIMTAFDITRYKRGDTANQRFLSAVKYNQGLADSLFAASVTWEPGKMKGKKSRRTVASCELRVFSLLFRSSNPSGAESTECGAIATGEFLFVAVIY